MFPAYPLARLWRSKAEDLRRYGAEHAVATLEACADDLEEWCREWDLEALTLEEAARESGYSHDHLSRLLRNGTLPNAGESGSPRIHRRNLPRKPGHTAGREIRLSNPLPSRTQMARSVVESE